MDHTQFDKKDVHFDASSKADNPKWSMVKQIGWGSLASQRAEALFFGPLSQVDVQYERMMKRFIPLRELKKYHLQHRAQGGPLKDMALFTRARLSVQPLTPGKSHAAVWVTVTSSPCLPQLLFLFSAEEFDFVLSLEDKEPL